METPRDPEFLPHDGPLREDVRRLGALVGQMLAEQEGQDFFDKVEHVRTAAIGRRRSGQGVEVLGTLLTGLPAGQAEALARAFATYFQAVNTAERVHRIRRRRDYQREGGAPQPESLAAVLGQLKAQGVSLDELIALLARVDIEPVFTAHPTEAVRRSLLEKEQEIIRALVEEFDPTRTPQERRDDDARILMALSAGWQTAEASPVRPSVQDEFDHVGFYLAQPIYRVLPSLYEAMGQALAEAYGNEAPVPRLLRFATWVGGDMDGNPNVGADTIEASLGAQRTHVLERYIQDIGALARLLSQTDSRVEVDGKLARRLEAYREKFPVAAAAIRPRHANMPYRSFLTLVQARLQATLHGDGEAYQSPQAFVDDIDLVEHSLLGHGGAHAGAYAVQRVLWRARTFGFHLARLDVRQDSSVHDEALSALLDDTGFAGYDAGRRTSLLRPYASGERSFVAGEGDEAARSLKAVFATLAQARGRYGADATGLYIISMARSAADVLAVLALARLGGMLEDGGVPLDVAPLFETIDDLAAGPDTLRALLADPVYRTHLARRGDRQWVMLGYSDSGKDGGTVASRWSLQRAQVELMEVAQEAGIVVSFFHGRGGSASRGGSRITNALMSSPRGSVAGVLRVTEQGEVIRFKLGNPGLATETLTRYVTAVLEATLHPPPVPNAEWRARMGELSTLALAAYRGVVREDPDFVPLFRALTPERELGILALGSRPSRRRDTQDISSLRAIPWVFAWTQVRLMLPAWPGTDVALASVDSGDPVLDDMSRWPFFRMQLDMLEMVLAKADPDLAQYYARRLTTAAQQKAVAQLGERADAVASTLLKMRGAQQLLQNDPALRASLSVRNTYLDPLHLLQAELLARYRNAPDDATARALKVTMAGISSGLRNTG